MKRGIVAAAVAVVVVAGAAYLASPYLAMGALRDASIRKDRDKLEALVDFPAVRESLKAQLNAQMAKKISSDPDLKDNPFAGIVAMMAPALIDGVVNAYVTPEGIVTLTQGEKPKVSEVVSPAPATPPVKKTRTEARYVTLDTFRVSSTSAESAEPKPEFVFRRHGLFGWRLALIELPADLMDR